MTMDEDVTERVFHPDSVGVGLMSAAQLYLRRADWEDWPDTFPVAHAWQPDEVSLPSWRWHATGDWLVSDDPPSVFVTMTDEYFRSVYELAIP